MSRRRLKGDAFFNVVEKPVIVDNDVVENMKAICRADTGKVLSVMSDKYVPVSNREVLESFGDICDGAGINWKLGKCELVRDGAKSFMEVKFPDAKIEAGKGDELDFHAYLINGFDGFSAAKLQFGFMRLICTNGAVMGHQDFQVSYRHVGEVNKRLVEQFKMYVEERFSNTQQFVVDLANKSFKTEDSVIATFDQSASWLGKKYAEQLAPTWRAEVDKQSLSKKEALRQWVIYNVFTYIVTHMVRAGIERRVELYRKISHEARKNW